MVHIASIFGLVRLVTAVAKPGPDVEEPKISVTKTKIHGKLKS